MMPKALYGLVGVLGALLAGCGGGDNGDDDVTKRGAPPGGLWYEADFSDPNAAARQHHTIILDLEPAAFIGEWLENVVRYELEAGTYRFCIDPDEEFITGFTLENAAGEPVLSLERFMDCAEVELAAGVYTKRITHDGNEILNRAEQAGEAPQSRVGFIQATNTPRVTDSDGRPRGGWWAIQVQLDGGGALIGPDTESTADQCVRESITHNTSVSFDIAYCYRELRVIPGYPHVDRHNLIKLDFRNPNIPFSFPVMLLQRVSLPLAPLVSLENEILSVLTGGTGGCLGRDGFNPVVGHLLSLDGATTFSVDGCLVDGITINDLGAYQMQLFRDARDDDPLPHGLRVAISQSSGAAVLVFFQVGPSTLDVLFRLYRPQDEEDTAAIADALQEGEVALFEECNYGGNMWVFASRHSSLARLSGSGNPLNNNVSSVRLGNNTTATLYSDIGFSGTQQTFIADTPCLQDSVIGDNTASALKIGSALELLISSNACVGCKLVGVDLSNTDLRNVDLRKADLRGANLFKAIMRKAKLNDTLLNGSDTNLNFTELRGAVLTGSRLDHASLEGADLRNATLTDATLTDARLTGAHLYQQVDLTRTTLDGADFSGALMAEVEFSGSIKNAKFDRAVLVDATFDNSALDDTTFNGAWLAGVNFTGATSVSNVHLTNACVSTGRGVWNFPELRRSFPYQKTVLGTLATDTSVFCPNGNTRIPCCATGDVATCNTALITPGDAPDADLSMPDPPPCLPDPGALDDPDADDALLCPPPQPGDTALLNCSKPQ